MKKIVLIIYILLFSIHLHAQTPPHYKCGYDDAGNRTLREYDNGLMQFGPGQEEPSTGELGESKITVFPNPTEGLLQVQITNLPKEGRTGIELRDMAGRPLLRLKNLQESNDLDLSSHPDGAYFLRVRLGNKVILWKVIKKK